MLERKRVLLITLHNDIIALLLDPGLCQHLNLAVKKSHIGCLETKLFRVVLKIGLSYFHLDLSHVYPGDVSLLADQLAKHIAISATPTAQIQNPAVFQTLRHHQTAAIIPGSNFFMYILQTFPDVLRDPLGWGDTSISLEVCRCLQYIPIVVLTQQRSRK